ncbi:hypothetical protein KBB48_03440 [Candidatus Shapirobacteria bacterium]|nr:hypothetical protein [Candidatus Shapirobacteria bacterium]
MAPEKKSEAVVNLPPKVKKAIAGGIVAVSLATGCGAVVEDSISERSIVTLTSVPTKDPETNTDPTQVAYELIPTQKATETMINPTPTYMVGFSGGEFTSTQDKLNQSEQAIVQQDRIQRWLDYWIKFDNRPFAEDSADIHWKYIYDNAKNPKEVLVLLEVGGEYNNKLFTVPMNENGFVDFPPTVVGSTIEAGLGPLEIDSNKDGTFLSVKDGVPVRINSEGEVVERLIQAQWEAVEKYPIDLEKLVTPPKNYEELKQHPEKFVQAPNPMENFEEFIKWYNETLFEKALGGDLDKLPVNYKVTRIGIGDRIMARNETEGEVLSVPKFFYFKDQNQLYPSYIVTLEFNGYIESYTVVMRQSVIEMFGNYQSFVDISKGEKDLKVLQLSLLTNESFSEEQKKVYEQGFGSYPSTISEIPIGFGTIFCFGD